MGYGTRARILKNITSQENLNSDLDSRGRRILHGSRDDSLLRIIEVSGFRFDCVRFLLLRAFDHVRTFRFYSGTRLMINSTRSRNKSLG